MKVQEIMERVGVNDTGRAIAYIKDALEEMNLISETHVDTTRIKITKDQRYYEFPRDMVKLTDIRCKNHLNAEDEYRSIPRMIGEPAIEDVDGN
jgi:hypothetical protein|tara:strand:+ start:1087 stop:1368 length:282 start_codon:yes stop_codon:yes gene_type:complete